MDRKEKKIDLHEVFNEPDRRLLLFKFDGLVRHLSLERADGCCCRLSGGQCHDINQVVTIITERLIQLVPAKSEHKFEALLYAIPWAKYLFETTGASSDGSRLGTVNRLQADVFVKLWSEYVQIFPHKSDKFIDSFMFLLRGDKGAGDDTTLSLEETALFSSLTSAMGELLGKVHTFETSLVGSLKKRYPFYHNTTVHEFTCYIGNLMTICDLLALDSDHYLELYHFLFGHLLAVDNRQFFEEVSERHVCGGDNNSSQIIFEFEDINTTTVADVQVAVADASITTNTSITVDERLKKFKVLDGACRLLFEYIDRQLSSPSSTSISTSSSHPNSTRAVTALISLFFSRLLTGSSIHVQYVAFYLCGRSQECCDAFVNDLWTISVSGGEALAVREGAFSYLISLLRHARFVHLNTVFSFLKILVQAMNGHLDGKQLQVQASAAANVDHDVMYYNFAIGFARLFTAFHADLATIQVDCLKSMDLKRALMNDVLAPVQYFPTELRQAFHAVASFYRIGYFNVKLLGGGRGELAGQKQLSSLSAAHRERPPKFGRIHLPAVRAAVAPFVNNVETLVEDGVADAARASLLNSPTGRGGYARGKWSEGRRSLAFGGGGQNQYLLATSPTSATNTSGDDFNGLLSSPNSFTPSSSNLMASMLSDMD